MPTQILERVRASDDGLRFERFEFVFERRLNGQNFENVIFQCDGHDTILVEYLYAQSGPLAPSPPRRVPPSPSLLSPSLRRVAVSQRGKFFEHAMRNNSRIRTVRALQKYEHRKLQRFGRRFIGRVAIRSKAHKPTLPAKS